MATLGLFAAAAPKKKQAAPVATTGHEKMIKAESAPLVKSEQIGSLAGRDQPGLTVGSKALEAPGDQAQQNHDETATLATAVAANSRLDSGLVLPTLGLPHYLFIKRARQVLKKGLPMAVQLSFGNITRGPSPRVKEIVSSILEAGYPPEEVCGSWRPASNGAYRSHSDG